MTDENPNGMDETLGDFAPDFSEDPFTLFFPGLTEDRAHRILELAESAGISYRGEVMSPRWNLQFGLDRATAQLLRAALSKGRSTVVTHSGAAVEKITPRQAIARLETLIEDIDFFLENSDRYPGEI
jgi:hypothetical protein